MTFTRASFDIDCPPYRVCETVRLQDARFVARDVLGSVNVVARKTSLTRKKSGPRRAALLSSDREERYGVMFGPSLASPGVDAPEAPSPLMSAFWAAESPAVCAVFTDVRY